MIRRLSLVGTFLLALASASCGDSSSGGGNGGTGGKGGDEGLNPEWCESIPLAAVEEAIGHELKSAGDTSVDCSWILANMEFGGMAAAVFETTPERFAAAREEFVAQGREVVDVSDIGESAFLVVGDGFDPTSLNVFDGRVHVFLAAYGELYDLDTEALKKVVRLIGDAL